MTGGQKVVGSNPIAPTKTTKGLTTTSRESFFVTTARLQTFAATPLGAPGRTPTNLETRHTQGHLVPGKDTWKKFIDMMKGVKPVRIHGFRQKRKTT